MKMVRSSLLLTSTVLAAGLFASTAHAQTAAAAEDTTVTDSEQTGIGDIIVTARKVEESLQSVPVAVTALDAGDLAAKQVFEVTDLARTAPSLTISTGGTGPASIVYLAIRGQAQNSPNSLSDTSVGIYIDGVYVARPIVGNLGFLDLASAEVLRGHRARCSAATPPAARSTCTPTSRGWIGSKARSSWASATTTSA